MVAVMNKGSLAFSGKWRYLPVCTLRIAARSAAEGSPKWTSLSKRPGRRRAGSIASGLQHAQSQPQTSHPYQACQADVSRLGTSQAVIVCTHEAPVPSLSGIILKVLLLHVMLR